jgi:putative ABC transport system permease protein
MEARVSASLFPPLGVQPMLGKLFIVEENAPGQLAVLLSYGLWQRRYGGAPTLQIGLRHLRGSATGHRAAF